jgi:hypothetical protein
LPVAFRGFRYPNLNAEQLTVTQSFQLQSFLPLPFFIGWLMQVLLTHIKGAIAFPFLWLQNEHLTSFLSHPSTGRDV